MASVDKRPNGQWRARWREYPGGPQKTKHFPRKNDAEKYLVKIQHDLLTGVYIEPGKMRTTVRDVSKVWLARQSWRPRTRLTAEGIMDKHFLPRFGDRPIGSVRRGDLEAWAAGLSLSPATVRLVMQYVSSLFGAAVTDGFIPSNPATGAKSPRVERAPVVPPTTDDIRALQDAAPDWFAIAVTLGAGAGLRQGEATGLTVDRVDFLRRQLVVDRQLAPLPPAPGEPIGLSVPKSDRSYRTVPLSGFVVDAIAAHVEQFGTGEYGVILHHNGMPVRRAPFGKFWTRTREAANLSTRFHDCRHFYASTLLSQGVPVAATADYLGHSPAVLLATYAHLIPEDHDRARGAVEAAFNKVTDNPEEQAQ
jgi:integrase